MICSCSYYDDQREIRIGCSLQSRLQVEVNRHEWSMELIEKLGVNRRDTS